MTTTEQWIKHASRELALCLPADSDLRLESELLLGHLLGKARTFFLAYPEHAITPEQAEQANQLLKRRMQGEPIAYITGVKEFWSLPLTIRPGVLVPRPDTEILVEKAIQAEQSAPPGPILDLGTGSGAIAIALAREVKDRTIIAIDKSQHAIEVCKLNIQQFAPDNVLLVQSDWASAIKPNSIAMVLANPPYIAKEDEHLKALGKEPIDALVSEEQGLHDLALIAKMTLNIGVPGCQLIMEHGYQQGKAVQNLLNNYTYRQIGSEIDLGGNERITFGTLN